MHHYIQIQNQNFFRIMLSCQKLFDLGISDLGARNAQLAESMKNSKNRNSFSHSHLMKDIYPVPSDESLCSLPCYVPLLTHMHMHSHPHFSLVTQNHFQIKREHYILPSKKILSKPNFIRSKFLMSNYKSMNGALNIN